MGGGLGIGRWGEGGWTPVRELEACLRSLLLPLVASTCCCCGPPGRRVVVGGLRLQVSRPPPPPAVLLMYPAIIMTTTTTATSSCHCQPTMGGDGRLMGSQPRCLEPPRQATRQPQQQQPTPLQAPSRAPSLHIRTTPHGPRRVTRAPAAAATATSAEL